MTLITVVFVAYLLLVLVVGAVASRYGRTMSGYFLADRRLGAWVTAISSVASSESGWLVLGLVGEAYMWGAKAIWTAVGCLLGYLCNWYLVAPRLRQHSGRLGAITIPDFFEERFRDRAHLLRSIGVAIILFCLMFYVSAQLTATGKAFQKAFGESWGITYHHGVLLGGIITVVYTLVGGFRAVSWTDLAQGLLMVFGLAILPIVTVVSVGGFGPLFTKLDAVPARTEGVFNHISGTGVEVFGLEARPVRLAPGVILHREALPGEDAAGAGGYRFVLEVGTPAAAEAQALPAVEGAEDGPAGGEPGAGEGAVPQVLLNGTPVTGRRVIAPGDDIGLPDQRVTFEKTVAMLGGAALGDAHGGAVGLGLLGWIIGLLGIGLGYPGQPHVLTRYMAARSTRTLHQGRLIVMLWGCIAMWGAVILGMSARLAVPGLIDPEQAYPHLATGLLPPVLAGILLAAIISAMMSTADSQLLVVSSAVARDLIEKTFLAGRRIGRQQLERTLAWITRLTVLGVGVVALILALGEVRAVFWFVLFAWSGLGAAFGPPLLLALFWRGVSRWGAAAGMVSGFATTLLWKTTLKAQVAAATGLSLYELVPAFAVSMILTYVVSLLTPAPPALGEDLEGLER